MMISINGHLVDGDSLEHLSPLDRGLLYGDGVFETFRVTDGHIEFMADHLQRLFGSVDALGIGFSWDADRTATALQEVVHANEGGNLVLRLTVTRGVGGRRLDTDRCGDATTLITASQFPDHPKNRAPEPLSLVTAPFPRNEHSPLALHKTLNYLEPILARADARKRGADEALFLNSAGRVAEAGAANIFLVGEEGLITPSPKEGALPGIARAVVLRSAHNVGIHAIERSVEPEELMAASELFITNSLLGLASIARLDGKDLPVPPLRSLTAILRARFRELAAES